MRALYLDRGGDPSDLDDIPYQDIDAWLTIVDLLDARRSLGGIPDG